MSLLESLNAGSRETFVATLGGIFEHSPWVAEAAWPLRPFASVDALHSAMVSVVRESGPDRQRALLQAHPELAGREARAGSLTAASTSEQGSAGLDALSREEMDRIGRYNREYQARFGFPFIIAVRDHDKAGIFGAFERRLANTPDEELRVCLEQVYRITRLRLDKLFAGQ